MEHKHKDNDGGVKDDEKPTKNLEENESESKKKCYGYQGHIREG